MSSLLDYQSEATYAQTRLPVTMASTLIPDAYRDAGFYQLERERLWGTSWICVGYTEQVARVGDTIVTQINDDSLIITRSAENTLSAFHNVCRHRGAKLITECGSHNLFRCPYHAWGYELDGKLKGAPYFQDGEISPEESALYDSSGMRAFDKADYGLLPVRVAAWGCLIFVNLDRHCAALEEQLGDLPQRVSHYPLAELVKTHSIKYQVEANWKLVAENFMEYYHLPWVHPTLNRVSHHNNHHWFQGEGMYCGMTTSPLEEGRDIPVRSDLPPLPGLNKEEQQSARWLWLFPNIAVSLLPSYVTVMRVMPDGLGRTQESFDYFFHPSARSDTDFEQKAAAVYDFWDEVNREDVAVVERVQSGLANKAYQGGRMCFRFEDNVHRFQNHVIDKITGRGNLVRETE